MFVHERPCAPVVRGLLIVPFFIISCFFLLGMMGRVAVRVHPIYIYTHTLITHYKFFASFVHVGISTYPLLHRQHDQLQGGTLCKLKEIHTRIKKETTEYSDSCCICYVPKRQRDSSIWQQNSYCTYNIGHSWNNLKQYTIFIIVYYHEFVQNNFIQAQKLSSD